MTDFQEITEEEAKENFSFLLTMCERNRTVFKIKRKDGSIALLSPVKQSGPPVDPEVLDVVEEFRKSFIDENTKLAASLQEESQASIEAASVTPGTKASEISQS